MMNLYGGNNVYGKSMAQGVKEKVSEAGSLAAGMTPEGRALRMKMREKLRETAMYQVHFENLIDSEIRRAGSSNARLVEETGISRDTIKAMRHPTGRAYDIRKVLAVCLALHLPPDRSRAVIAMAPGKMGDTVEMLLYQYALDNWFALPMSEINRKLREAGARPLFFGREEDDEEEEE